MQHAHTHKKRGNKRTMYQYFYFYLQGIPGFWRRAYKAGRFQFPVLASALVC